MSHIHLDCTRSRQGHRDVVAQRLLEDTDYATCTGKGREMVEKLPIPPLWVRADDAWTSFA
jgi:hypothetical protein